MSKQPGLVVIAVIAVVSVSAFGGWPRQAEPREPHVKLLRSNAARSMPVPMSWCSGSESGPAAVPVGDSTETRM